jgi:hypothetical protein
MGRGIVVRQEPTALCSKLYPRQRNALQQSSDNLNVLAVCPSGTNSLWITPCDQHGFDLRLRKRNILDLGDDFEVHCMLWRFVSSHIEVTMTHTQLQCNQENWDCLHKSGCSLGMIWVSVASAHPCDCVGRTLLRSSSSVNFHGGFDEWSSYLCLIHLTSFWESIDDLVTILRKFAIVSAFREVEGRRLLGPSWRSSRPSLNRLSHSSTQLRHKASSSYTVCNIS